MFPAVSDEIEKLQLNQKKLGISSMDVNFDDLPWHDANLKDIHIDRSDPGNRDTVEILVEWPDGLISTIEFYDCYALKANMNFGIAANESIFTAQCLIDSDELNLIRNDWLSMGAKLESLKCFRINTNSTNSLIDVFAKNYRITDHCAKDIARIPDGIVVSKIRESALWKFLVKSLKSFLMPMTCF
ncbi:hypothetical protein [Parachlamydia acanthamoebae]|uniref:hypothetical protein n=1 Tax=Parachlamydia acanthamoebae TaxID=83552 RepID=UPI001E5DF9A3|nr:hypothetical protein [Parachlamydia acanthamoebae]